MIDGAGPRSQSSHIAKAGMNTRCWATRLNRRRQPLRDRRDLEARTRRRMEHQPAIDSERAAPNGEKGDGGRARNGLVYGPSRSRPRFTPPLLPRQPRSLPIPVAVGARSLLQCSKVCDDCQNSAPPKFGVEAFVVLARGRPCLLLFKNFCPHRHRAWPMSRNDFAAINDVEKLIRRKLAPMQRPQLCQVGRRFRLKACKRAIPFAGDAMTTGAILFIRHLASA